MSKVLIINQEASNSTQIEEVIIQMGLSAEVRQEVDFGNNHSENAYDLILLNADNTHQTEKQLLQQIKNMVAYKRVGVIVVTDDQTDDYLAHLWEMGAHDFIAKPINALELEARVNSVLQQQASLKKIDTQNALLELKMEELQLQKEVLTEQKTSIAQANEEITDSINYAKRIQESMLPAEKDIKAALPESFMLFRPCNIVSGDFYWFAKKQLSDYYHKLILAVVDCTGHGVPGAFMSMIGDSLLNYAVHDLDIHEPDQILAEMDQGVWDKLNQSQNTKRDGMDVSLCMVDVKEKVLKFAGARQHLVYFQNNELFFVKGDKSKIGGVRQENPQESLFRVHTIDISTPTWVYLFTDGYQNQLGGSKHRKLKGNRFRQLLQEVHHYPTQKQLEVLESELESWIANETPKEGRATNLVDDVLVWGFKLDFE
ncbi:MAG TPA: hypothetical protein DCS93_28010 [Microscillaceae bacterium]|nr:hypothetical protein [Microscillaceae bacterium]